MNTYTVLLADDEEEVIQVIMKKIDWEALGFSVIGYAANGIKALEMVEEFQPDVVMTDIKMPYMDGMELSKRIKEEFPATKILLFTGFDEFEYAKEAVHLEVEEYILKPLNAAELSRVFEQTRLKLEQEINEKRNVEILKKYYLESLPVLRINFYTTLLEGRIRKEEAEKYFEDYQISLTGPFFCCIVIHVPLGQASEDMNPMLLSASVQKQAEERLGTAWNARCFPYLGKIILIAQLKNESDSAQLTDDCERFCRYVRRMIGTDITIGIGHVCSDIFELAQSYDSAKEAVSYRAVYGVSRAINIKEIAPEHICRTENKSEAELTNLFKIIRLGENEEIGAAVDKYLKCIFFPEKSLQQHYIDIMELISALYRFAENNDINSEAYLGDMRGKYMDILGMEPDRLRKWFINISLFFQEQLISARKQSTKSFVSKAKNFVRQNYSDEGISLDSVCDVLGVSNAYFSSIFKKETGNSFVGYLTDFRMEQASRLLIETNEKSYIIAKRVGYTDPNYFSYVFKRRFGVSPSKYRMEYTKIEK